MTLEIYLDLLRRCADTLAERYLCPVYLVGSFERKFREASDIDLIMVMPVNRMKRLFGTLEYNDKRARFNRKQKLWCEEFITDFDIDFKVSSTEAFETGNGKKLKLDKYAMEGGE